MHGTKWERKTWTKNQRIINTAAKLILSDIRSINLESDSYPLENEIVDINICKNLLPESLKKFLEVLTKNRLKRVTIVQVLINAARPKSAVLLIPFGLGVEMDNMFDWRWLIDVLSKLGFSVSYQEVRRYKQSVVENDDSLNSMVSARPEFGQWVADNINHNTATLEGKKTFHGMGIIAAFIGNGSLDAKEFLEENKS